MTKSTYEFSVFCIVTGTIIIFLFGILVNMICEISHERALEPTYYSHRDATYCTKVEKSRLTYYEAMTYGGSCCRDEKITIYDRSGRKCVITKEVFDGNAHYITGDFSTFLNTEIRIG